MLEFEALTHTYRWCGQVVPSVTQILSRVGIAVHQQDGTLSWRSISGAEFIDDSVASKFGTEFHRYCEIVLRGQRPEYDPGMEPWVRSWNQCRQDEGGVEVLLQDSVLMVEWKHYCQRYGYAMTLDLAAGHKLGPMVTDWKTSEDWDDRWWLQQAAYAKAAEIATGRQGWHTRIVQVKPWPTPCRVLIHTPVQVRRDWNAYLSINNVYRMAA
jgi:hypothetical protein